MISTRRSKINLAIAIVSSIFAICIIVVLYLYITTDSFKSDKVLFQKYSAKALQNLETLMIDDKGQDYNKSLENNKYTSTTEITADYKSGIGTTSVNTQSPINNLKLVINGKTDKLNGVDYRDAFLKKEDADLAEIEYLKSDGKYGIRFTDLFDRYIAVENHDLKDFSSKMGLGFELPDKITETNFLQEMKFTEEEKNTFNENYINTILNSSDKAKFSSEKKIVNIEVGNESHSGNSYTLNLSKEQLNNLYITILEQMKEDQTLLMKVDILDKIFNPEIAEEGENVEQTNESGQTSATEVQPTGTSTESPEEFEVYEEESENTEEDEDKPESIVDSYKKEIDALITKIKNKNIGNDPCTVTVYESDGSTIRFEIKTNEYTFTIDTLTNDINNLYIRFYKEVQGIDKNTDEVIIERTENAAYIDRERRIGDEIKTTKFSNERVIVNGKKESKTKLIYDIEKNRIELNINTTDEIVNDFDSVEKFTNNNNVIMNNLTDEEYQEIKEQINDKGIEKLNAISEDFDPNLILNILQELKIINEKITITNVHTLTMSEVTRFNAQFEMFKDQEVQSSELESLLKVAQGNLDSLEQISDTTIKLNIVKGEENEQLIEKVTEIINNKENKEKKYHITCQYDEETQMLNAVTIEILPDKQ